MTGRCRIAMITALCALIGGCGLDTGAVRVSAPPSIPLMPNDSLAAGFARGVLDGLQAQSFRDGVEYCGYLYVDSFGALAATPPVRGRIDGCSKAGPQAGSGVFASYHTHGGFDARYDSEVPGYLDLANDFAFGIDGYISTPGGRLWHVDAGTRTARLICGPGCVRVDPAYRPQGGPALQAVYTEALLRQRQSGATR